MPLYDYRCENGHVTEILHGIAEDGPDACVECGAPVERVLHPVAVHFKGSGFYSTDYGSKKKAAADAGSSSDSKNSSSSDSSGSSSASGSDSSGSSDSGSTGSSGSNGGSSDSKAKSSSSSSD